MAINPACNALTSVSRLRAAGFGGNASEDSLQLAINAVSAAVERGCDRVLSRVVTYAEDGDEPPELLAGTGRRMLVLQHYPVIEVLEVKIGERVINDWRLIPGQGSWGGLYRARRWPRLEGAWGELVGDPDGDPFFNVEVSYRAGFYAVEADLEHAVMQEVDLIAGGSGGKATRRVRSERTPGGWSVSYGDTEHECSVSSARIFAEYRRKDLA